MIALLTAILFPLALMVALATIGSMFHSYGGKMLAALKLEHRPVMRKKIEMSHYAPMRDVRTTHPLHFAVVRPVSALPRAA